jgi:hypothetical protein
MSQVHAVKVFLDEVGDSSPSANVDVRVGTPARFIPRDFCHRCNLEYRPEYGVFLHHDGANEDDDQGVEWIDPNDVLPSALLSSPSTILVVRTIIAPSLQSKCDPSRNPDVLIRVVFGSQTRDLAMPRHATVSRIPAKLYQLLDLPYPGDLVCFAGISPGNWRELPPDVQIERLGWRDGQSVRVELAPREVRVLVHIGKFGPGPRELRLPRTARISEIRQRVGARERFIYACDGQTKKFIPLPENSTVAQIEERFRESLILTNEEKVMFLAVKCVQSPGGATADLDCRVEMSVGDLATQFIFGIVPDPDARFEVWRQDNPNEKLDLKSKLIDAGIHDGDTVFVKVSSRTEEHRIQALVDALKFRTFRASHSV